MTKPLFAALAVATAAWSQTGHLTNIRQLTTAVKTPKPIGRPTASASSSSPRARLRCDQIFIMNADGSNQHLVSTGKGRTTCGYFLRDNKYIVYASTISRATPAPPIRPQQGLRLGRLPRLRYLPRHRHRQDLKRLTDAPGYDAEATVNWKTGNILFTSLASGDLDLWTMRPDGSGKTQITKSYGYDGGAVFSRDGKKIVWRAGHPTTPEDEAEVPDRCART